MVKANTVVWWFFGGVVIGLLLPLVLDWYMFGDFTPCHSIQVFEDGSSLQACNVKE